MDNFYQEDLAFIHHYGFGDFARGAGEEILKIFESHHIHTGLIVDLGCGSGIWAARLLEAGFTVQGVDISPAMLSLARVNAPGAQLRQSSVYDFQLPPCQAITALGEVLGYGVDGLPDYQQLERFFQQAADSLSSGGLLIFDVIVSAAGGNMTSVSGKKGPDWAVVAESREFPGQHKLVRDITLFREVNGYYRRTDEVHPVRLFDPDSLVELLQGSGFTVTVSDRYGQFPLANRRRSFVAEKKADESSSITPAN